MDTAATDLVPVTSTRSGDVVTITLDAPRRRNPLSTDTLRALGAAFDEAATTDAPVIVLASSGPVWCTGHDLREMSTLDEEGLTELFETCTQVMRRIETLPQVVIARVHALATAAGCQLVASCDLAVAGASARFATPGGKGGLFCHTPMVAVAHAIGRKRAAELALTGDEIDAVTAAEWGLINRAVPDEQLDDAVAELAARVSRGSRWATAIGKRTLYAQMEQPLDRAYEIAVPVMAHEGAKGDGAEGIASFVEKRRPVWTHTE